MESVLWSARPESWAQEDLLGSAVPTDHMKWENDFSQ